MMSPNIKTNSHIFLDPGESGGLPGLRCARCRDCGRFTLGRVLTCSHCFSNGVEEVAAGRQAQLIEFSIARHPAGGFEAPYAIGQIRTEEGMSLFAPLVGEIDGLVSGTPLEFALVEHQEGKVGFAFRRVAEGD